MKKGFTLIELLVVIAIIAILAVVIVLTINPAELLRQGRDVTRVSDMGTLNKAASLYYQDAMNSPSTMFMGTSSVIYVSVPDPTAPAPAGNQCTGLGLPTPPTGYTYHCAASSTYMKVDGTGWVPINFNSYSAGTVISKLPTDPINTTSTNLYYTYETDGIGGFKVAAFFESQKDAPQMANDSGNDPELYEKGSNLALASGRGLVGYWPMDEGTGTAANDQSGNGNNGTMYMGSTATDIHTLTGCKVGNGCATFNGTNAFIRVINSNSINPGTSNWTVSAWFYANSIAAGIVYNKESLYEGEVHSECGSPGCYAWQPNWAWLGQNFNAVTGQWILMTTVYDHNKQYLYKNGVLVYSVPQTGDMGSNTANLDFGVRSDGGSDFFNGLLDDIRIYNRALSASEIQEMYNAEK